MAVVTRADVHPLDPLTADEIVRAWQILQEQQTLSPRTRVVWIVLDEPRLSRTLTWIRRNPEDNGYARPVANVLAVVDLNEMKVVSVEDHGVVPLPPEDANYSPEVAGRRADLKPIEVRQPEGPSFELEGHQLRWQKWTMRLGYTPREGLVLHTVAYRDGERERPILYRASVVDMVVPYGDPRPTYFHRNAFDVGEY